MNETQSTFSPANATALYTPLLDALPVITYLATPDGTLYYLSTAGSSLSVDTSQSVENMRLENLISPADRERVLAAWETALRGEQAYRDRFRLRFSDGSYRWVVSEASPLRSETSGRVEGWLGVFLDVEEHHRTDEERERVQRGFRLLAQTGAVALTSLESVAMTRLIARACIANFASLCSIDIIDESGKWERASAHRLPEYTSLADALPLPKKEHPIGRVMRSKHSSVTEITETWIDEVEGDSLRAQMYRLLGMRSIISAPISTPSGEFIGALTCGIDSHYEGDNYVSDDLVFVEEVGRRIGSLIENARLYARERRIAVELQAASLPVVLPRIDHLHLDAEYRPSSAEATIGGDWYDAFILRDGRVVITVGDVLGHGLRAAVTMTKLRQAMQAAAMIHADPTIMLKVADETLKLIDPDEGFATAVALIFDPVRHEITFASAGHPGPIMRHPDGTIEDISAPGMMLGLRGDELQETKTVATPHGTTFMLFTDGIVEATRDMEAGYAKVHDALRMQALNNYPKPANRLVEYVLDGAIASDDIAVLIATVAAPEVTEVQQTRYGRALDDFALAPITPGFRTSSWQFQSSDADSAQAVRHSFIAYASGGALSGHVDIATAELVLGELIGNVVRHAPGLVTVDIEWRNEQICIAVSDEGPVFTIQPAPAEDQLREHGRGLQMITACTTSLRVIGTAGGGCRVEAIVPHLPH